MPGAILSATQRARLGVIAERAAAWGPLTWCDEPGDVVALRLGASGLGGKEVVAAMPDRLDGRVYDVWGKNGSILLETGLNADEVIAYLKRVAPI